MILLPHQGIAALTLKGENKLKTVLFSWKVIAQIEHQGLICSCPKKGLN